MIKWLLYEAYVYTFWCFRFIHRRACGQEPIHHIKIQNLPWLWLGAVFPDKTHDIEIEIFPGTLVTPEYLEYVTGYKPLRWEYLDAKTLEQNEFPSEGFLIKNETTFNSNVS